ncbi:MAG: TnsD family transposase [Tildeniella torsiva UHER 1998/13D]|jgi:hypothetical protein|nr:TnsD family transposase [Tildeniella torsiva UHER 1998/13D]
MIGCFPDPHPDELFYSVCCRYKERTRFSDQEINFEILGHRKEKIKLDLPSGFAHLSYNLPESNLRRMMKLIRDNTLLPLYIPFLSREKSAILFRKMLGVGLSKSEEHSFLPSIKWARLYPKLRYCPRCAIEDRKEFKEAYWHRVHQASCVSVCPEHGVFLLDSIAEIRGNTFDSFYYRDSYVSAEKCIPKCVKERKNDLEKTDNFGCLFRISKDVDWLLRNSNFQWDFENSLQKKYVTLFDCQLTGYCHESYESDSLMRQIRRRSHRPDEYNFYKFYKFLADHYSAELLESFGFNPFNDNRLKERNNCWLFRLIFPSDKWYQEPIKHLLFVHFFVKEIGLFLESSNPHQLLENS